LSTTSQTQVFARSATGLVRGVSPFSAAIFNLSNAPIGFVIVYSSVLGFGFFAGGSVLLGTVLAVIGSLPVLVNYVFLTASMPRTGGDYVFTSRLVHPALGFAANFGLAIIQIIGAGAVATFVALLGVVPACSTLATITGDKTWAHIADWAGTKTGSFIIGSAVLTILALLLIRGTSAALRFNNTVWFIGFFSLVMMILILLFTSRAGFTREFNSFVGSHSNLHNGYNAIIGRASAAGFKQRGSLEMLWPLIAVGMFGSGWFFWSTYISGEIKGARQLGREMKMIMIGAAVNAVVLLAALALIMKTFGYVFISSLTWMLFNAPDQVPFFTGNGAHLVFLTGLAAHSHVLAAIFSLTFIAWTVPLLTCYLLGVQRCAFAWSFDQVVPTRLSQVNPRTGTPVLLIVIVWALAIISTAVSAYTNLVVQIFASTFLGTALFSMLLASLAAILFPYRKPDVYNASPVAKYKVGSLPLIVITGTIGVLFTLFWCAAYVVYPEFGMHQHSGVLTLVLVGSFVLGLVIYYLARAVRIRQGVPMKLVFADIPPE
jgi:basic amino acid/polyamine antiporter, APA family